ncbi:unnamed protein product [Brachionus calyciflorus]|uniref:Uncharacterized protein n=1 Tax=Brachionus calyciflorus TaxID=104777 RepID=A0A814C2G8_9BILA|nr:unnamed protein product [Brachionus calyciflorus]
MKNKLIYDRQVMAAKFKEGDAVLLKNEQAKKEGDINSDNQLIDVQEFDEQQTVEDMSGDDRINGENRINDQNTKFDQGSVQGNDQDDNMVESDDSQIEEKNDPTHKEKIIKEIFVPDRPGRNRKQPDWYGHECDKYNQNKTSKQSSRSKINKNQKQTNLYDEKKDLLERLIKLVQGYSHIGDLISLWAKIRLQKEVMEANKAENKM